MDKINYYEKRLGLFSYSLEEKKKLNKDLLQDQLEKITKNYDRYIPCKILVKLPIDICITICSIYS